MYLQHFGLRRLPFETTANGTLWVDLPTHREATNAVLFGLRSGEGFVKVVGEVGTGKTALCRNLLRHLDDDVLPLHLPNPAHRPLDLLRSVSDELGIPAASGAGLFELQKYIREVLVDVAREGRRTCVLVDEAQTMPRPTLEQLRLLSNLENDHGRLLQVVLFAQPELDESLAHHDLRQLQQRIAFSARLTPLDREDCRLYIRRRLIQCGARARAIFTPNALDRIQRRSGGIPRLINVLSHKSLLAAFADGDFLVDRAHVDRAARDTDGLGRWRRLLLPVRSSSRAGAGRWRRPFAGGVRHR